MFFLDNMDDIEDAIDRCQVTANAFPEISSSHEVIGMFVDPDEAECYSYTIAEYLNNRDEVITLVEDVSIGHKVSVQYTLSAEEFDDSLEGYEAFLADQEEFGRDEIDAEIEALAEEILRRMKEEEGEDDS